MKKIGLSVCYDTKNFGSQLQVLATVKKIEEMGFETEIIRYKKKITPHFILQTIPRFFNSYFIIHKRVGECYLFFLTVVNIFSASFPEKYFLSFVIPPFHLLTVIALVIRELCVVELRVEYGWNYMKFHP